MTFSVYLQFELMRRTKMNCLVRTLRTYYRSRQRLAGPANLPASFCFQIIANTPSQMPADPIIITQTTYLFFIKQFFKPLDSTPNDRLFC